MRQPPLDEELHHSVRMGEETRPRMCSAREQLPNGSHKTSAQGKRTPEQTIRVIPTNLISGIATVRALPKAGALAQVQQRINPKSSQNSYEFRIEEFLETVERTQCAYV